MYNAIVCSITTAPIPGADRIKLGYASGFQVIVGAGTQDGQLGILLADGGAVTESFGLANGLFRKHPVTNEPIEPAGYLDSNGRIRTLKLRKQISNGIWLPLSSLVAFKPETTEEQLAALTEGQELESWGGEVFYGKYYTPATKRAMALAKMPADLAKAFAEVALPKHYDTAQLRHCWRSLPEGQLVVTEKLHGTSGRTGNVPVQQRQNWFIKAINILLPKRYKIKPKYKHTHVTGTRNCLVKAGATGEKGMGYRIDIHDAFEAAGLLPDEVIYYEVVGFDNNGSPIMSRHSVDSIGDPKLERTIRKDYGDVITYSYGCNQETLGEQYHVYVYRITQGGKELTYDELVRRCRDIDVQSTLNNVYTDYPEVFPLQVVPLVARLDGKDNIMNRCEELSQEQSMLTRTNPREGVCVRVESETEVLSRHHKYKGFVFCALEGIAANNPDYVDAEDVV